MRGGTTAQPSVRREQLISQSSVEHVEHSGRIFAISDGIFFVLRSADPTILGMRWYIARVEVATTQQQ